MSLRHDHIYNNDRLAGLVKRYHTWPVLREQSVAEHSWQVFRIYERLFGPAQWPVTVYIMYHDCGEIRSGDIPWPVKSINPDLKRMIDLIELDALQKLDITLPELGIERMKEIKLCHDIEMWEYALEEVCRGNTLARPIMDRMSDSAIGRTLNWYEEGKCNYEINKMLAEYMLRMKGLFLGT